MDEQKPGKRAFIFSILTGIIILILSLYGHDLLKRRSGLPEEIDRKILVRIDETEIRTDRDEEFALALKRPGESADFVLKTPAGTVDKKTLPFVRYYAHTVFPLIYLLIGLACISIGLIAFILRPHDPKARIYYWLSLAFGSAMTISGEFYCLGRAWTTFLPGVLFIWGYALTAPLLLAFSLAFGGSARRVRNLPIFLPAVVIAGAQTAAYLYAFLAPSIAVFRAYNSAYVFFRIYFFLYAALSIVFLVRAARRNTDRETRAQIQWIFFGLIAGMLPFLFLYQVPTILGLAPLIPEEISVVFFLGIPITFFVAIVKYKLMHIELVINRSLVYSILTIFTVGIYMAFIELTQRLLSGGLGVRRFAVSAVGVLLAAIVFHPAQQRIQQIIDKAFFRQSYDYRKAFVDFNEKARGLFDRDALLECFQREVLRVLPLESLRIGPLAEEPVSPGGPLPGREGDFLLPLTIEPGRGPEHLSFGRKKAGSPYTPEDRELLRLMSGELQVNLDRIRLQEEVITERASREKLDELNRLKTEFVSTVSHELRTPLASLQSLAELLQSGKVKDRDQADKYFDLMAAESSRLSRFLHNVLDYGKIEQGLKTYHFRPAILQDILRESADVFRPLLEKRGFRFELKLPRDPVRLDVDADAVEQAVINLIDNAMKYSGREKFVAVELVTGDRTWNVHVRDRGLGIPAADKDRIFETFFRSAQADRLCPEGAGLGLKIIRHIMDAHGGDIEVESKEGEGSTFTLTFPKP